MKYSIYAVGLLAFAGASPAFAQDTAPSDLTGPRIEIRGGYDVANFEAGFEDATEEFSETEDSQGLTLGGEIGFDAQLGGNLIVGGYIGADSSSILSCGEVFGQDQACLDLGLTLTAGGRVGTRVGRNSLVYAKAGYSHSKIELTYDDFEDILEDFEEGSDLSGFHLGGGFELGLDDSSYLKLDYTFTNYTGAEFADEDVEASADINRHQVMFGFGFRF